MSPSFTYIRFNPLPAALGLAYLGPAQLIACCTLHCMSFFFFILFLLEEKEGE